MRYFSTFSGIGGFELGIQQAYEDNQSGEHLQERGSGRTDSSRERTESMPNTSQERWNGSDATCVGYCEIDKYAIQTYEKHFNHKNYGDITKINATELPDFDLLVGGFPCQAFSIAGKRRGFDDTRGTLFFDIARILKEKQPRNFILENVKGLLSHDGGNTFKTIITTLAELGYCVEWQVLNSKNFGVPQNRERVFIIGHLRGGSGRKVFPITRSSGLYPKEITSEVSDAQRIYTTSCAKTLKGEGGGQGAKTGLYAIPLKFLNRNQKNYQGDYSFTVDTVNTGGIMKDMRVRRLTPVECERLQGFPEVEKECIIEVCKNKNVNGAKYNLNIVNQDSVAQSSVLIDCVESGVEIHSQGKLLLNAKSAEKKNWCHRHIKIDDFAQMLVGINTIAEKITSFGEAESPQNEQCLTHPQSGKKLVSKFGSEIMQPVGDVKSDLTILKELLKYTIYDHLDTKSLEQRLTTLYSFVIRAIIGYIPREILNQDTFTIKIKTKVGYTYGVSDTQRYKMCGNAVTTNVITEIIKRL